MSAEKKFLRKKKLFEKITGIFKVKLAIKRYPKQYIKKVTAALTAGILGVVLAGTMPEQIEKIAENRQEQTAITAWWGTLYPKFCFSAMDIILNLIFTFNTLQAVRKINPAHQMPEPFFPGFQFQNIFQFRYLHHICTVHCSFILYICHSQ